MSLGIPFSECMNLKGHEDRWAVGHMSYTFEVLPLRQGTREGQSTAAHIEEGGGMDGPDAFLGRLERNQERSGALDGPGGSIPCEVGRRKKFCGCG